jgi:phosphohistidine swiveling domain-containing protein
MSIISGKPITLSPYMSREHSLFYADVWNTSNATLFDRYVSDTNIKNMLFRRNELGVLEVYYDLAELDRIFRSIAATLEKDPSILDRIIDDFYVNWKELFAFIKNEKKVENVEDLKRFYHTWVSWWSPMAYLFVIPDLEYAAPDLREKALKVREETQEYSDEGDRLFKNFIAEKHQNLLPFVDVLLPQEVFEPGKINMQELEARNAGVSLVTIEGETSVVLNLKLNEFLQSKKVRLELKKVDETTTLKGQAASKGVYVGPVRLVLKKSDLNNITNGDVMVTYATSPDYVPAMKKCGAIVTDEGGVVCHAAIVSRELGVPCVVGTKVATKVLKDGDRVEVDAEKGIVTIKK